MIVLLLLLYTHVFLRVQFLALFFSPCMLGLCLPLSTLTLSYTIHLLMTYNYRCQLLHHFTLCSHVSVYIYIRQCLATANMFKLNDNKTELMLVTTKRTRYLHNLPTSITIGNAQFPFKHSVKNLDFTLDCHLAMNAHVSNIARTCHFKLRRLSYIRRFLTCTSTATLVSAFVLSRIDY